jgi:hypothetical protein
MKFMILPALFTLALAGCSDIKFVPQKNSFTDKELANGSGRYCISRWIEYEWLLRKNSRPGVEQLVVIRSILYDIEKNVSVYPEGGVYTVLPGIRADIDKALPGEDKQRERLMTYRLAEALIGGLDDFFDAHRPDLKTKGAEVAGIVSAFTVGARDALD